jgi:phage baseplate assembly protein W
MIFWMQQAHQLSQQSLHSTQRNFIVAIGVHYRNQLNIRGNKHISIATLNRYYHNAQSVVAIATHKGNHLFRRGINTNLLQQLFQQTQPTLLVAITPRYRNALIRWFL